MLSLKFIIFYPLFPVKLEVPCRLAAGDELQDPPGHGHSREQAGNNSDGKRNAETFNRPSAEIVQDHTGNQRGYMRIQDSHKGPLTVSYTHLRAHETDSYLVCRLLLE